MTALSVAHASNDLVRLGFDHAPGSEQWRDDGRARSQWINSGAVTVTTAAAAHGVAGLSLPAASAFLYTPLTEFNAVRSGLWFIRGKFTPFTTFASRYIAGVEDAGGTAAGSSWFFYHDASRRPYLFYSDGVTRASINGATSLTSGTTYDWHTESTGTNLYLHIDGTVVASVAFSGTLALPAAGQIRIGQTLAGNGPDALYADCFQMGRRAVYGGSNFTPATGFIQ